MATADRTPVDCSQVLAALGEYLDDDLSAEARTDLETHLASCANCSQFGRAMASVIGALRRLQRPLTPALELRLQELLAQGTDS